MAARMVGKIGISEEEISRLVSITMALAPLIAIIGVITAIINFAKEGKAGKTAMGGTLLQKDNSRKRNQKMNLKGLMIFGLQAVVVLGVMALTALAFKYAAPMLQSAAAVARQIDMVGVMKMLFTLGGLLLIGGLVIGMTMKMMKGKETSSKTGLIPGMGSNSSKPGALGKNDLIMAAILLPLIVISMVGAAYALKLLPSTLPKLNSDFISLCSLCRICYTNIWNGNGINI